MSIEIKNRWTGAVLRTVGAEALSCADLSRADLSGADLTCAILSGADLTCAILNGAILNGADLRSADLTCADLTCAILSGADLIDAYLNGADLRRADLRGADLRRADLRGADLRRADLSRADLTCAILNGAILNGADLSGANLRGADLTGVADQFGVVVDLALPARIVAQIEAHPETHQQDVWHSSCGTRHCIAGFATHLSGPVGRMLECVLDVPVAATLLLWRPGCVLPSFEADATEEETLGRLRVMAAAAEQSK